MNLIDRIFAEPELRAAPPVLVDVGAAGGVHPAWRRVARHAIGVGFEPDAREAAPLDAARGLFAKWIFCRAIAVPQATPDGRASLHLTASPQCSSALPPAEEALREWTFAEFFRVNETRTFPAMTLQAALTAEGIHRIDWLKCDTQGLDLKLYESLPAEWRAGLIVAEFEPGLMDAYVGEDRLAEILTAMAREPFWLSDLNVGQTARGRADLIAGQLGAGLVKWVRRLGPLAPGWANARFMRDVALAPETLDRRAHLLAWVFATITGQHGQALTIADIGGRRFPGELFTTMTAAGARSLRWAMLRAAPGFAWRRLTRT